MPVALVNQSPKRVTKSLPKNTISMKKIAERFEHLPIEWLIAEDTKRLYRPHRADVKRLLVPLLQHVVKSNPKWLGISAKELRNDCFYIQLGPIYEEESATSLHLAKAKQIAEQMGVHLYRASSSYELFFSE